MKRQVKKKKLFSMILIIAMLVGLFSGFRITAQADPTSDQEITSLVIENVATPTAGKPCSTDAITVTTVPADAVTVTAIEWEDWSDPYATKPIDKFIEGHIYYVKLTVEPKSGYKFTKDGLDSIMGPTSNIKEIRNMPNDLSKIWIDTKAVEAIKEERVTSIYVNNVGNPIIGESCSTEEIKIVTNPAGALEIKEMYWQDLTDNKKTTKADKFVDGHEYSIHVELAAKDAYIFDMDTSTSLIPMYTGEALVDGNKAASAASADGGRKNIAIIGQTIKAFATPASVEIQAVNISGFDVPVAGQKPDYEVSLPKDAPYRLATREEIANLYSVEIAKYYNNGIIWFEQIAPNDKRPISSDTTFIAGKDYKAGVVLTAKNGYFLAPVSGTINGKAALYDKESEDINRHMIAFTSVSLKAANEVVNTGKTGTTDKTVAPTYKKADDKAVIASTSVKTGNDNRTLLWIILLLASATSIVTIYSVRKKRKSSK